MTADLGSGEVVSGSFQLVLGGHLTQCIQFNATSADIRLALLSLNKVQDVDVAQYNTPHGSSFPFEYKIMFKGEYQYGEWPILSIHEENFGVNPCDPFLGGSGHSLFVLPISEEASCAEGNGETQVILAEANSPLGGSFDIYHGSESIRSVLANTNANEMKVNTLTKQNSKVSVQSRLCLNQFFFLLYMKGFNRIFFWNQKGFCRKALFA